MSWGHSERICSELKTSLYHIKAFAVLSHPPMPIRSLSAKASAALRQCTSGAERSERGCSCWKQRLSHARTNLLSVRRCISCLAGSANLTHWCLWEGGTLGTSALHEFSALLLLEAVHCEASMSPAEFWRACQMGPVCHRMPATCWERCCAVCLWHCAGPCRAVP